jgi:hypothetical protein
VRRPTVAALVGEGIQGNSVFSNTSNLCSNFHKENCKFAFSFVIFELVKCGWENIVLPPFLNVSLFRMFFR